MKDDIDPSDGAATDVHFAEIATQKLDGGLYAREIGLIPGAEIVDHSNVVPESNEPRGKMRTDEAGPPRH